MHRPGAFAHVVHCLFIDHVGGVIRFVSLLVHSGPVSAETTSNPNERATLNGGYFVHAESKANSDRK